jgi:hypothetical protein
MHHTARYDENGTTLPAIIIPVTVRAALTKLSNAVSHDPKSESPHLLPGGKIQETASSPFRFTGKVPFGASQPVIPNCELGVGVVKIRRHALTGMG